MGIHTRLNCRLDNDNDHGQTSEHIGMNEIGKWWIHTWIRGHTSMVIGTNIDVCFSSQLTNNTIAHVDPMRKKLLKVEHTSLELLLERSIDFLEYVHYRT